MTTDLTRHIVVSIDEIRAMTSGLSQSDFEENKLLRLAVERAIGTISRASRHIPAQVKVRDTSVHWQRVAEIGDVLQQTYYDVDVDNLWTIIREDLDPLRRTVRRIVDAESQH